jgi:hypothetical protein
MGTLKRSIYDVTRTSTDLGEGASATDEAAGYRNRRPDVACDRDRDQIEAADAAIRRVESDPICARYEDLSHAWVDPASLDPTLCWFGL